MTKTRNKSIHRIEVRRPYSIERPPRDKFLTPGLNRENSKDCIGFVVDLKTEDDE